VTQAFEWFVAARYLKAKRRQGVIGLVTVLSIAGIAAGVMAMIIALAVNNGFRNSLQRNLLGATPHVMLMEKEPSTGIENWRELARKLSTLPHVVAVSPGLYGQVFIAGPVQSSGALLKGIPLDGGATDLSKHMIQGSVAGIKGDRGLPGLLLGSKLAKNTGLALGNPVTLVSPQGETTPFGFRPATLRFRVTGIYETGFYDLDNQLALTSLATAQRVFALGDVVSSIELKLDDPDRAPEVARLAEAIGAPKLGGTQWMEQNRQLLNALRLERAASVITISLIQIVAALNILTALVMSVMEKRRGIAILLSLGAKRNQIRRIFVVQGLLLGATGIVLGLAAGYTLCYLADKYRWIRLDEAIYSLSAVPFEVRWTDGIWVAAAALGVSLIATLHPALSATRVMPVETLRYE
jgi:lipoprotein-releasing system permease protein